MSGWDDKCDGKLRLRTELLKHRSGKVTCPSQVEHEVRIDNVSVCDLQVSFVSTPGDSMLGYHDGEPWRASVGLSGASRPRKDSSDSQQRNLTVKPLNAEETSVLRSDLSIKSSAQYRDANGNLGGPIEQSVLARLRLTLRSGA